MIAEFLIVVTNIGCNGNNTVDIVNKYTYNDYDKARLAYQQKLEDYTIPSGCIDYRIDLVDKSHEDPGVVVSESQLDDDIKSDKIYELDKDKSPIEQHFDQVYKFSGDNSEDK